MDTARSGMLRRGFAILGAFRPNEASVTAAELARRAGLSKATGHRIVQELLDMGILDRTESGVRPSLKLFELGQLVPMQRDLRRAALPFMFDLKEATKASVHLAVLDGTDVVYIDILQRVDNLPSRVGGRLPSHATGVGKAMLAFAPAYVLSRLLEQPLRKLGPNTITDATRLRLELKAIRQRGVAFDREEAVQGLACAAAPVLNSAGAVVAGLSLSHRVGSINLQRVAPAVHMAALGLGRSLDRNLRPIE